MSRKRSQARKAKRPSLFAHELIQVQEILEKYAKGLPPDDVVELAKEWEQGALILRLHAAQLQGFAVPPIATSCMAHSCAGN